MAAIAATSDMGTYRSTNEDACCLQVASTSLGEVVFGAVCDGVGGLSQGEVASTTVIRRLASWFSQSLPSLLGDEDGLDPRDAIDGWNQVLVRCNGSLLAYGQRSGARLATTCTGVIACDGRYVVAQVGDSRLYLVHDGTCAQVTQDQTYVGEMVAHGELTPEEAIGHPHANVITQAIGARDDLCPVFSSGTYEPGDLFVLCTDGIHRTSDDVTLMRAFAGRDLDDEDDLLDACDELMAAAIAQGERDNLTIACFAPDLLARQDDVATIAEADAA